MSRTAYLHRYCTDVTSRITAITPEVVRYLSGDNAALSWFGKTYCGWCKGDFPLREFVWVEDGYVTDIEVGT